MSKKVLITGGTGFIGRHTLLPLINADFEVICGIHRSHKEYNYWEYPTATSFTKLDLLDSANVREVILLHRPEYLLHLAWDVTPGYKDSLYNIEWMNASLNLIHQFSNYGGRRAVLAGTCFDYNPNTLYGACKRSLWSILNYARYAESLELAYGRIYYLYGPYEAKTRLVPTIINELLDNKIVKLKSHPEQGMLMAYVQDIANSFVTVLDNTITGEFDLPGYPTTIATMANLITEIMDIDPARVSYDSKGTFEMTRGVYNALNLKLNNINTISLTRGLTKTINWWKDQRK